MELGGIAWPTWTTRMDLDVPLDDLRPLSRLPRLEYLSLKSAHQHDLTHFMAGLSDEELVRWDSLLDSGLDEVEAQSILYLEPLSHLVALKTLYLNNNAVSNLDPIARLTNLERLDLSKTKVSDLSPLADLSKLDTLFLNYAPVSELGPLSQLANLRSLHLNYTNVVDLTALSGLRELRWLHLDGTGVTNLEPLHTLTSLRDLQLGNSVVSADQTEMLRAALPDLKYLRVTAT